DAIPCAANRARLMRYHLLPGSPLSARRELVRCFTEYQSFDRDASFEQLSDDGRYIALLGVRSTGASEVFAYDIPTNVKHTILVAPNAIDWAGMAPSGRYVLGHLGGGVPRMYRVHED